jgi:hypothetical protein
MQTPGRNQAAENERSSNEELDMNNIPDQAIEPVLTEEDMEENNLREEDLDNIEWDLKPEDAARDEEEEQEED